MKFKARNLRAIAELVVGDAEHFPRRSSFYITKFFEECDLDFAHDGSTRAVWAAQRLEELLEEPQPVAFQLPTRFVVLLRTLMDPREVEEGDLALPRHTTPIRNRARDQIIAPNDSFDRLTLDQRLRHNLGLQKQWPFPLTV